MSQLSINWSNNEDNTITFLNKFDSQYPNGTPLTQIFTIYNSFSEFIFRTGGANNGQMSATRHFWENKLRHNQAIYFYYPPVANTPLEFEVLTNQQATNNSNRRFQIVASGGAGNELRLFPHRNWTTSIVSETQAARTSSLPTGTGIVNLFNNIPLFTPPLSDRVFQFGVHTHGTFCGFNFHLNSPSDNLTNFTEVNFEICGFLKSNSSNRLNHKLFILNGLWEKTTNPNTSVLNKIGVSNSLSHGITINDAGNASPIIMGYIPRGSFTESKQNFLHEIRIYNNVNGFKLFNGTVDSRIAIIGRGVFEQMKIYSFKDIFGRTGTEHWLCLGSLTCNVINANTSGGEFTRTGVNLGQNIYGDFYLPNEHYIQPPDIGDYDFLLVRVKVENRNEVLPQWTNIAINPISSDDIVEESEWSSPLAISGTTTFVPNSTPVTVSLNSVQYTGSVSNNQWNVTVPVVDLNNLTDYSTYNVQASLTHNSLNYSRERQFKFGIVKITDFLGIPCSLWLDSSDTQSLTLNVNKVSNWADKSGSNNNASMSNPSLQPTYVNGMVSFNGVGIGLTTTLNLPSSTSIVLLCQQSSTDSTSRLIQSGTTNSVISPSRATNAFFVNGTAVRSGGLLPINTYGITTTIFGGGTTSQVWEGGINHGSGVHTGWGSLALGGTGQTTSVSGMGEIAELLVFPSRLTTAQVQIIEGYLAHKWENLNLISRLGATHPYLYSPPF